MTFSMKLSQKQKRTAVLMILLFLWNSALYLQESSPRVSGADRGDGVVFSKEVTYNIPIKVIHDDASSPWSRADRVDGAPRRARYRSEGDHMLGDGGAQRTEGTVTIVRANLDI